MKFSNFSIPSEIRPSICYASINWMADVSLAHEIYSSWMMEREKHINDSNETHDAMYF